MARPRKHVHREREQVFVAQLVATGSFTAAKRLAGIDADHVIRLMDRADFRSLAAHMLAGDLPAVVAVEVAEPDRVDQAARMTEPQVWTCPLCRVTTRTSPARRSTARASGPGPMAAVALADRCLDATNGNGPAALALAVRLTRYRLIAEHRITPHPAEPLPLEVRHARAA